MKDDSIVRNVFCLNVSEIPEEFVTATWQTLYMVYWTALIAGILGIALGVLLVVIRPDGLLANRGIYEVFDKLINMFVRSFYHFADTAGSVHSLLVGTTIGEKQRWYP